MKEVTLEKVLEMIRAKYEKALKLEYVKKQGGVGGVPHVERDQPDVTAGGCGHGSD